MKSRTLSAWEISRIEKGIALLKLLELLDAPELLEDIQNTNQIRVFFKPKAKGE